MIMADVLKIFLLVTGAMAMTVAYGLLTVALVPAAVERWQERLGRHPFSTVLVGTLLGAVPTFLGVRAFAAGNELGGLLILGLPALVGLVGSSALGLRIGRGLVSRGVPCSASEAPWRSVAKGSTVLVFCLLLPFLGWFVLLPLVLAAGIGVVALGTFAREPASRPVAMTSELPPPPPLPDHDPAGGTRSR